MVTGANKAGGLAHLNPGGQVDVQIDPRHAGDLPSGPAHTSASLWPTVATPNPLHVLPQSAQVVQVPPPEKTTAQLLINQWVENTPAKVGAGVAGAIKDQLIQVGYDLTNGVLGNLPNRQIKNFENVAPDWLKNLARTNEEQQTAGGAAAIAVIKKIPDTVAQMMYSKFNLGGVGLNAVVLGAGDRAPVFVQELAANNLRVQQELRERLTAVGDTDVSEALLKVGPSELAYSLTNVLIAGVTRKSPSMTADGVFKSIGLKSPNRIDNLAALFRRNPDDSIVYGARAAGSRFVAKVNHGTLEFDFSTLRARRDHGSQGGAGERVTHRYFDTDQIQAPDGAMISVATSGKANEIQAELLAAAVKNFSNQGAQVKRVKVSLDALLDNDRNAANLVKGLDKKLGGPEAVGKAIGESIRNTSLGRAMQNNGFERMRVEVDTLGNPKGVVFYRSDK